ncbi:hypothetical protein GCM10028791_02530 [Echinicola sediminis]
MNPPYFHLLINIIPVLGSFVGLLMLGYGLFTSSQKYDRMAFYIFIISAIGTAITYLSGFYALDHIAGSQTFSGDALSTHQYIAQGALASMLILGLLSLWALYSLGKDLVVSNTLNYVILGVAFVSFAITVSTAIQGMNIRHEKPISEKAYNSEQVNARSLLASKIDFFRSVSAYGLTPTL